MNSMNAHMHFTVQFYSTNGAHKYMMNMYSVHFIMDVYKNSCCAQCTYVQALTTHIQYT